MPRALVRCAAVYPGRLLRGLLRSLLRRRLAGRLRDLLHGFPGRLRFRRLRSRSLLHGPLRDPLHRGDRAAHRIPDGLDGAIRRLPHLLLDRALRRYRLGFRLVAHVGGVGTLVGLDVLELSAFVTDGIQLGTGSAFNRGAARDHGLSFAGFGSQDDYRAVSRRPRCGGAQWESGIPPALRR